LRDLDAITNCRHEKPSFHFVDAIESMLLTDLYEKICFFFFFQPTIQVQEHEQGNENLLFLFPR